MPRTSVFAEKGYNNHPEMCENRCLEIHRSPFFYGSKDPLRHGLAPGAGPFPPVPCDFPRCRRLRGGPADSAGHGENSQAGPWGPAVKESPWEKPPAVELVNFDVYGSTMCLKINFKLGSVLACEPHSRSSDEV